jgi:hypothetical protein
MRNFSAQYVVVMKDSSQMVAFIAFFVCFYSWIGKNIFAGTIEGVMYFPTFADSVFHMLVCLTTSNFPDVMLPAYLVNRVSCLYFLFYLIMGLFLFLSLLLAIVYSNFKIRFLKKIEKGNDKRSYFLLEQFNLLSDGKEYLTELETYKMFILISSLSINKKIDLE